MAVVPVAISNQKIKNLAVFFDCMLLFGGQGNNDFYSDDEICALACIYLFINISTWIKRVSEGRVCDAIIIWQPEAATIMIRTLSGNFPVDTYHI